MENRKRGCFLLRVHPTIQNVAKEEVQIAKKSLKFRNMLGSLSFLATKFSLFALLV